MLPTSGTYPSISALDISNISVNESNTTIHGDDTVSTRLYELLEKNVQKMAANLASRENSLAEKDETIEILEKKIEVLTKARAADVKKGKKVELELKDQIKLLENKIDATLSSSKERESRLLTEINTLRKKVIK